MNTFLNKQIYRERESKGILIDYLVNEFQIKMYVQLTILINSIYRLDYARLNMRFIHAKNRLTFDHHILVLFHLISSFLINIFLKLTT